LSYSVKEVSMREKQEEDKVEELFFQNKVEELFFQSDCDLTSCPPGCGAGSCGSNCKLCCLYCGIQVYCDGQCPTCPQKKKKPALTFYGEMATTMLVQTKILSSRMV
jgi:hypothetical protein